MFRVVKLTGLWQHADFMKLWLGQTVSLLGDAVTDLALPLTGNSQPILHYSIHGFSAWVDQA